MHIQALHLVKFMGHDNTKLTFPAHGVVTLQGHNGAGKSALVEGVSVAFWGQTLRDNPPWSSTKGGLVRAAARIGHRLLEVERTQAKGLTVILDGVTIEYETNTKAQAALDKLIGPWDVWRRCSVFSSGDAAHFSLATDAERKRLLERVVGVDQFDVAAETLRARAREAAGTHGTATMRATMVRGALTKAQTALKDAEERLAQYVPSVVPSAKLDATVRKLGPLLKSANDELAHALTELETAKVARARVLEQSQIAERALAKSIANEGKLCRECGQPWPDGCSDELKVAVDTAREVLTACTNTVAEWQQTCNDLRDEAETLRERLDIALAELGEAKAVERERAVMSGIVERARVDVAQYEEEASSAGAEVEVARVAMEELQAAAGVVGVHGARSIVLTDAIEAFSRHAQEQVSRFAPGVRLKVRPFTEKKKGGINDSISIEVDGFGGGAYKGASQGERRRLDVALLLALGQLEASCSGYRAGTLFADEVFDALDAEGVETLREALGDLAKERCVVVITHAVDVLRSVKGSASYEVSAGKVRQL